MKVVITGEQPVCVKLQGRLDTTASIEVTPDFQNLSQYATGKLLIDCSELEYISSSGLRLFLALRKEVATQGGTLQIMNLSDEILQIFRITGFISLFDFCTKK